LDRFSNLLFSLKFNNVQRTRNCSDISSTNFFTMEFKSAWDMIGNVRVMKSP
jgi:hypothetical protein